MRAERGFTVLEVLVALLVLALALAALIRAAGDEARALEIAREATFAQWIAGNVIAQTRLAPALPHVGRRQGETEFAGRRWRWEMDVDATQVPDIRRLDVRVYAEGEDLPRGALTGFASR